MLNNLTLNMVIDTYCYIININNDTLTLVTLGCLAASNCQPGHHGVSAISNNLHGPGCC